MAAPTRDAIINAVLAAAAGRPVPKVSKPDSLQLPMPSLGNVPASRTLSTSQLPPGASEMVYSIRVPKQSKKKLNVMRFNHAHNIDFSNWKVAHMEREDNSKQFKPIKSAKEALPKFGAGSEFGRDKREAARRRKYGMYRKKYKPQDQPWILKIKENLAKKAATGSRPGQGPAPSSTVQQIQQRKFKGTIEGGFKDNSAYYIFEQKADGIIEAYPVHQWLNFTPIQTYKALSAEEAEEEFGRRNKNLNLFTLMAKKRWKLQNDDGEDEEGKGEGGSGKGKMKDSKSLRVSEMDDWDDDDEDDDAGSDEGGDDAGEKKNKKGKGKGKQAPKKKKKGGSDDEPLEESDDGDEEGLELDYISDSSEPSEDEDEKKPELAGVDQEKTGLLESDSSDEENAEKKKAGRNSERDADKKAKKDEDEGEEDKAKKLNKEKHAKKKDKLKKKLAKEGDGEGASGGGFNMPDLNNDDRKVDRDLPGPSGAGVDGVDASGSDKIREGAIKRKTTADLDSESSSKRSKLVEVDPALLQLAVSEGITEEAVRKYLLRKPMTVAELLQKFKQKQHKISNEDMVPIIAHLLKKINPSKSKSQTSKLYFFLKPK